MDKNQIHQTVEEPYLSPSKPSSLGGVDRPYKEAKTAIPGLHREDVVRFLQAQFAYTQHRPARRKFKKRRVIAVNINDVYHIDLIDMQKFSEHNGGYKYIEP